MIHCNFSCFLHDFGCPALKNESIRVGQIINLFFTLISSSKPVKLYISQKPWPGSKPGQAKPKFWLLAQLTISSSPSCPKPGQSQGFQAKPELAHHYTGLHFREIEACYIHISCECNVLCKHSQIYKLCQSLGHVNQFKSSSLHKQILTWPMTGLESASSIGPKQWWKG